MLPQNRRILDQVVVWHTDNVMRFSGSEVEIVLTGPSSGGSKDGVQIGFVSPVTIATVDFWDSGEYDIISMLVSDPENNTTVEVDLVTDEREAASILDRVATAVVAAKSQDT